MGEGVVGGGGGSGRRGSSGSRGKVVLVEVQVQEIGCSYCIILRLDD